MIHEMKLEYHQADDGIWLVCTCGWEQNLGFGPTIADAIVAENDHNHSLGVDE